VSLVAGNKPRPALEHQVVKALQSAAYARTVFADLATPA
jgi:hypothetical protein